MADSAIVRYSGDWAFHNGAVANGSLLIVCNAGTDDLASIFLDSGLTVGQEAPNPLTADASGLLPFAWIGVQPYKVRLTTSGGTLIDEQDNLSGAFDSTPFLAGAFAKPDQDFTNRTSNYTVAGADLGGIINGDCSGGAFDFTLISAVTATNGKGVTLRHVGTANTIGMKTVSGQTITSPTTGVTTTAFELIGYGESVTLESDGSNWHMTRYVPPLLRPNTPGVIVVADRVTSAPASSPGTRYIVQTGFSTFETHDIIEDNGQGGFIEITPPTDCGWLAYVQDEDRFYSFKGSAWVDILNTTRTSDLPVGTIVGRAYAEYTGTATLSVAIPSDNTIPQNTEGTEILTASITPKSATNRVRVRFQGFAGPSGNVIMTVALFRDSIANALTATANAGDATENIPLEFEHVPGTTSQVTYKIRAGTGSGTMAFNALYGGVGRATLVLEEIAQ